MSSWALTCKHCGQSFEHFEIGETLADYVLPPKPVFPPEGLECECPGCKAKATYQQNDLKFHLAKFRH
jgi:hypothetical protein